MICPKCHVYRSRKDWKASQWWAYRADIHDFNCCKACSPDGIAVEAPLVQLEALEYVRNLRRSFEHCTSNGWAARLALLFEHWVWSPHGPRKIWSYYGALSRERKDDPCGLVSVCGARWDPSNPKSLDPNLFYDPSNSHYKLCMELLFPGALRAWNQETVGDIVESLLGLQYLIENDMMGARSGVPAFPHAFVNFLHDWCHGLYQWMKATAWRRTDIVYLRKEIFPTEAD
jgi:hypothetical protein